METDRQEGKDDLADGTYYIIADFIGFVKMVLKKSLEKRIFFLKKALTKRCICGIIRVFQSEGSFARIVAGVAQWQSS